MLYYRFHDLLHVQGIRVNGDNRGGEEGELEGAGNIDCHCGDVFVVIPKFEKNNKKHLG